MAQSSHKDEQALANAPIGPLMLKLALPAVAAQVINMLYNIVDRIYIGHIPVVGQTALTGVGVTFPIIMLISAFAAFAGQGGAPLASIRLGAGDREGAERILGNSLTMLLCAAVVLTISFSIFKEPLLMAFGASEDTIGYGLDYIGIYLLGTLFVQLALGLKFLLEKVGLRQRGVDAPHSLLRRDAAGAQGVRPAPEAQLDEIAADHLGAPGDMPQLRPALAQIVGKLLLAVRLMGQNEFHVPARERQQRALGQYLFQCVHILLTGPMRVHRCTSPALRSLRRSSSA